MQQIKENDPESNLVALEKKYITSWNRMIKVFCGGLIAVNLLIIQGYLSLTSLDIAETASLYILATTLPFLILCAILCILNGEKYIWNPYPFTRARRSPYRSARSQIYATIFIFASTLNLIGVIALFFHFSIFLGFLFFLSIFAAFLLFVFSSENEI